MRFSVPLLSISGELSCVIARRKGKLILVTLYRVSQKKVHRFNIVEYLLTQLNFF